MRFLRAVSIAVGCLLAAPCFAQEASEAVEPITPSAEQRRTVPVAPPQNGAVFKSAVDLNQKRSEVNFELRGGRVADTDKWPASLYLTYRTSRISRKHSACTAALVGPQVVLTAAHCVPRNRVLRFTRGDQEFISVCDRHTQYNARPKRDLSADFALCKIRSGKRVHLGLVAKFERIADANPIYFVLEPDASEEEEAQKRILLTGYGCTKDAADEDEVDGKYRIGETNLSGSSRSETQEHGSDYYGTNERHNLFTRSGAEYANLCPGDSGGPAFSELGGVREIIGVNSRVFLISEDPDVYGSSLVSGIGLNREKGHDFRAWAQTWAERKEVIICGISDVYKILEADQCP